MAKMSTGEVIACILYSIVTAAVIGLVVMSIARAGLVVGV